MSKASDSSSIQKVCRILRALSVPDALRLADVCATTGLNKATVLRLLEALADEGFVERDEATKRYRLGEAAMMMGLAAQGRDHLRDRARPWLMRLAALCGDTVILSVRSGAEALCVDREFGSYPIRANYLDVGSRRPLGVGAGSLALLAWLPDAEVDAVLADAMPVIAARYPRIDEAMLRAKVVESRRQGFALLLDVVVERMGGIGMPILGTDGRPIGALSIAALNERLTDRLDVLVASLREAAEALSPNPPAQAALRTHAVHASGREAAETLR
ncbi:MAG: IclR family transcriptional regulator [Burkholderiales bacterium]|jgi:DNA-binding IclR family transcriptional regulator